jgi:hypothetical protein
LLIDDGFDHSVDSIFEAYNNAGGRPSIPLGAYFDRLPVAY